MPVFPTSEPITLHVDVPAGRIVIRAADRDETQVEVRPMRPADADYAAGFLVDLSGGTLTVKCPEGPGWLRRTPEIEVAVDLPTGSNVVAKSAAADITASGRLAEVKATSASGDITVEHAADVRLRSASGDVSCDVTEGTANVESMSGEVRLGRVRDAVIVKTASGDTEIGEAGADVTAKTASGDLEIRRMARGRLQANAASGDIIVGVVHGPAVWLDVSSLTGKVTSHLERGGEPGEGEESIEISARTLSGDITITKAGGAR